MVVYGTHAPKGRSTFEVTLGYTSPRQYFAGVENEELETHTVWARNLMEARAIGLDMDTRNGTAVGWEFLGVVAS